MKNINFMPTISAREQRSITRWFLFSLTLLIISLIIISVVQTKQLFVLKKTRKEYARMQERATPFNVAMAKLQQAHEQEQALQARMNPGTNMQQTITALLDNVLLLAKSPNTLHNLTISDTKVELQVSCPNRQDLNTLLEQMRHLQQLEKISIHSMKGDNQKISATISAIVTTTPNQKDW